MDVNINLNAIPQCAANDVGKEKSLDSAQMSHHANMEASVVEPTQLLDHSNDDHDDDKGNIISEQIQVSGQSGTPAPASPSSHAQLGGLSMRPLCTQTASSLINFCSSSCGGNSLKVAKAVLDPKTTSQQQGASSSTSAGSLKKRCETHSEDAASETSCLTRVLEDLPPEWNGLPSQEKRLTLKRMAEEFESKAKCIRLFLLGSRPVSPA